MLLILGVLLLIVSRAKIATPYLEIRVAWRVLICWHASPTPGKAIENRRRAPEPCAVLILPWSLSACVTCTLFCYRDVF